MEEWIGVVTQAKNGTDQNPGGLGRRQALNEDIHVEKETSR
jgi:hypothetical protein